MFNQKEIIALGGPPGCGKDTIADLLCETIHCTKISIAKPLRDAAFRVMREDYTPELYAEFKANPQSELGNLTMREWMIQLSEDILKPMFGKGVFGQLAVDQIYEATTDLIVIADSGFLEEQLVLLEEFGEANYLYVAVEREGTSFAGDSRGYLNSNDLGQPILWLKNNSTPEECLSELLPCVRSMQWILEPTTSMLV